MLNADILSLIFSDCDLESCIALSQTCSSNYAIYQQLDSTLVREKVLKRVPWFELGDCKSETWRQCASVIVNRSRKGLDPKNKHLYLLKDMRVAAALCQNSVAISKGMSLEEHENIRKKMIPLFEGESSSFAGDFEVIRGSSIHFPGIALDLKTMKTSHTDHEDRPDYEDYSTWSNEAVSPSGIVVRHQRSNGFVRVMNENDNLIHVRFRAVYTNADTLIYKKKPYHKAADGAILVGSQTFPLFTNPAEDDDFEFVEGALVSLLPGQGGALVVNYPSDHPHRQMVVYVEPTERLEEVLICTVPLSHTYSGSHSDSHSSEFYTFYKGYLYLYFAGRFFQLWVDMGYRSELSDTSCVDDALSQKAQSRCLVVWNRNVPVIGTFDEDSPANAKGIQILRGPSMGPGANEYVSVGGACGRVFGHLESGITMFSSQDSTQGITIPMISNGNFTFGGLGMDVANSLLEEMIERKHEGNIAGGDMTLDFNEICLEAKVLGSGRVERPDIEDEVDGRANFSDSERKLDEEYPWSDSEDEKDEGDKDEEHEKRNVDMAEGDANEDSSLGERDYDDEGDLEEDAILYADIFREIPVELTPTTMNAPKAFRSVDNPRKKEPIVFYTMSGPIQLL